MVITGILLIINIILWAIYAIQQIQIRIRRNEIAELFIRKQKEYADYAKYTEMMNGLKETLEK